MVGTVTTARLVIAPVGSRRGLTFAAIARRAKSFASNRARTDGVPSPSLAATHGRRLGVAGSAGQAVSPMRFIDKLSSSRPSFSFEFFPPKDEAGMEQLYATIADLRGYEPAYVSVTWGAGGSTQRLTVDLVTPHQAANRHRNHGAPHLRRSDPASRSLRCSTSCRCRGIDNVLPLRGDPPRGQTAVRQDRRRLRACRRAESASFARRRYDFCLAAACYPGETSGSCGPTDRPRPSQTQGGRGRGLFDHAAFLRQRRLLRVRRARARLPASTSRSSPGIMPITNLSQIKRFTAMCGARIPERALGCGWRPRAPTPSR